MSDRRLGRVRWVSAAERRVLAMGLNEAAGCGAVAATALATGYIAEHANLRPEPFYLGLAFAGLGRPTIDGAIRRGPQ